MELILHRSPKSLWNKSMIYELENESFIPGSLSQIFSPAELRSVSSKFSTNA